MSSNTSSRQVTDRLPELTTLVDISRATAPGVNLKAPLHQILEILEERHDVIRSAITLLQDDSRELRIEAAAGLSRQGRSASYRVGEGITGRVVESGKPIVVPQISREPLFLKRADKRSELSQYELSFFCLQPLSPSAKQLDVPPPAPRLFGLAPFQWTVSRLSFSTRDSGRCGNCGSRVAASKRLWESRSDFHGLVSFHNS